MGQIVRAAVYLRISLDTTGEQLAVTRQREDCLAIVRARGWHLVDEYIDNSVSASDAKRDRPAYNRLVDDYEAGRFDALVCWDLDRLTRQPRQLEDWIDAAEARGLRLVTANGEADLTTDAGRLFARIKAAVARAEVERKSARQKRAQQQRAELGRPPAGVRLTGYTLSGEVVEDEAALVRAMFDRFAAGDSLKGLARWLTEQGTPTRTGRPWNPSSVRGILANARYAGRSTYKGEDTGRAGTWPPIVTAERFALVQTILSDPARATNRRGTDRQHLGSGLYRCGVCGQPVSSWSGQRYRCKAACVNRSRTPIDRFVTEVIHHRLTDRRLITALSSPTDEGRAAQLAAEARQLRDRLAAIEADYDAGRIDGRRYQAATGKTRELLAGVEREQAKAVGGTGAAGILTAPDPVAAFAEAPVNIRQRVVDTLCTISLLPGVRGSKAWRPDSVRVDWKL